MSRTKPKRLWDMNPSWMCSVIGTCLTLAQLQRLKRRNKIDFAQGPVTDYELHAFFVQSASNNEKIGRALQALIERKYHLIWKQFARAASVQELEEKWLSALSEGDVAGAYWALLAHPMVTPQLEDQAFGEVHMLSHMVGSTNRADLKTLRKNEVETDHMREDLDQSRCDVWSRDRIIARLRTELEDERRAHRNALYVLPVAGFGDHDVQSNNLEVAVEGFRQALGEADKSNSQLQDALARKAKRIEFLESERARLKIDLISVETESRLLESAMPSFVGQACSNDGGTCPGEDACPYDLCRKRVLYVGGRATLVSRYRDVVEGWNGEFLHHDGGLEQSFERLGGMLDRADVVVFPADCVSHAAVERIKTQCGQSGTRMMAVRSSGLGSFMRGLHDCAVKSANCVAGGAIYDSTPNSLN
ncbi:MAG: DUF2325 domain-containing protein [Magnetovibrio sp.]|nr:DUF2325 domain-containing protein [Magnetovibrio sp.]